MVKVKPCAKVITIELPCSGIGCFLVQTWISAIVETIEAAGAALWL
jgi:hypothetical protein